MAKAAKKKEPKGRALKVFRTAIGFHDAYVAAPSKKAALAAWGTDKDLFARGAAEVVDDPALTAEPLAAPGTVIRRTRGSLAEQLKAAGSAPAAKRQARAAAPDDAPPARKRGKAARPALSPPEPRPPRPRPSRDALGEAEAARDAAREKADETRAALREEEEALRRRREAFEREQRDVLSRLDEAAERARRDYEAAMERWRAED